MRILFDATPLQTGHRTRGVGTYTRELLRALFTLDRRNAYRLLAYAEPAGRAAPSGLLTAALGPLPDNVEIVALPQPRLGRLSGFASHQLLLPALLARQPGDLFHSPGFVAAFSVPGVPWWAAHKLVVTLHDFIPLRVPALFNDKALNRWWYARQMQIARRADRLICVSEATRQDALQVMHADPARCVVVHEGVDRTVFYPAVQPAPEPPFILFVGGAFANKNRPAALAAFAEFCRALPVAPHRLVLVGQDDATDDDLLRQHPALDLSRVQRLLHVTQDELAALYRHADLFLFPSTCEGFGLPVLEAMASGTPVITSTVSSLPEVAGEAALLVDPQDVNQLAAAMVRVVSDRALHARLRTAGLARVQEFTWQRMAAATLAVYEAVATD